jgi:hypothetical protein
MKFPLTWSRPSRFTKMRKPRSSPAFLALILGQHALIEAQVVQVGALFARFAELEAKLTIPAKTPDTTIEAMLAAYLYCDHALGPAEQPDIRANAHIELPPIRPITTLIKRHRGVCPCSCKSAAALAPEGCQSGSPFGPSTQNR